jgi:hypothetical protein
MRALKHLFTPHWIAMRAFPKSALGKIGHAIKESERQHDGELRFAVEAGLPWPFPRPRKRAEALFALLGVWDTAHHSGVLIYLQLVDRRIEIVADRGIAAKVQQSEWDAVCRKMQGAFAKGEYLQGSLEGIADITRILARHFPPDRSKPNELPDKPVVL